MPEQISIGGGVLIGGKSARMGTDKATMPWGNATILETIVHTARQVTTDCVLLGAGPELPRFLKDMKQLRDPYSDAGPMAGLAALLAHFPHQWCLLLSCDIPNVSPATITALVEQIAPDTKAIAYSTPMLETCCTLYHASVLPDVERAIAAHRLALHRLIRSIPHVAVPADAPTQRALFNINAPVDYTPPQ
ncbi:MAG: molybdenum cofactor guanylyltransferase [Phycisphaerae bacterium]